MMKANVISVLGTVPQDIPIDGVEIYDLNKRAFLIVMGYINEDTPYISNSDAHTLGDIGKNEQAIDNLHPLYNFLEL